MARFSRDTLSFILKASRQKKPDWLDRNREEYERLVLEPFTALARRLKSRLAKEAPGYHFPQKGIARLKRPAQRALEHGGPFKNWLSYSAARPRTSMYDHHPNLFFLLQPEDGEGDEVLLAAGLYMPSSRQLKSIREAIAADAAPFEALFRSKAFAARFPGGFSLEKTAKRPPRGFDPSHPRIDWLKLQGYFVWRSYRMREFTSEAFFDLVADDCRQGLKLNALLERALTPGGWTSAKKAGKRRSVADSGEALERIEGAHARPSFDF